MAIQYDHPLDRTFHALGDASRRGMLSLLAQNGECSASELGAPFGFAQPTISKHIKVLERAGLVERRVEGRSHKFKLVPVPLDEADAWIERHRAFWEGTFKQLDAYLKKEETTG